MAFDLAAIAEPVSADAPCGPDFDLAGDPDFSAFLARAEGLIPASYFAFERSEVDFPGELKTLDALLADSRDLRLLAVRAKLAILNRDLEGFVTTIEAIRRLMEERWEALHPALDEGDASLRMATLSTLDDIAPVVLPLQHLPIAESRRYGSISYRAQMIASGEIKPREEEETYDQGSIDTAFKETELAPLVATRDHLARLKSALDAIRTLTVEKVGFEQSASFDRLAPLAGKMLVLIDGAVGRRDPAAKLADLPSMSDPALAPGAAAPARGQEPAAAAGWIASRADATAALAAIDGYFSGHEPSSAALLLVRQATQLVGKSFHEVMRILVPNEADQARLHIGGRAASDQPAFDLPLDRLAEAPAAEGVEPGWSESANGWGSEETPTESDETAGDEIPDGEAGKPGEAGAMPGGVAPSVLGRTARPATIEVHSRQDAMTLLGEVGSFFRRVEPSSPIPLLTERARGLADTDFLSLLKEFLPAPEGSTGDTG